jgi:multisubunit Na+/H+ antiporter MnhG subunit
VGLFGLFLFNDHLRKIACLSVAYSSLIILIIFLFKNSENSKELFAAVVTILIIFGVILAVGIGIISNAANLEEKQKSNKTIIS